MRPLSRLAELLRRLVITEGRPQASPTPAPSSPSPPAVKVTDPVEEISKANEELRATAKWILTSFAAIGALFAGGVQMSSLGKLTGDVPTLRVVAAVLGMALAVVGIAAAIGFTSMVLAPFFNSFRSADKEPEIAAAVLGDKELVGVTYSELKERMGQAGRAVEKKRKALRQQPEDPQLKRELEGAEAVRRAWSESRRLALAVIGSEVLWKRYERARNLTVFLALPFVVVGVAAFSWGANPPEGETKADVALGQAPVLLNLKLTPTGVDALKESRECSQATVQALMIAGTPTAPELVTIPTSDCKTVRFALDPTLGTPTAASP